MNNEIYVLKYFEILNLIKKKKLDNIIYVTDGKNNYIFKKDTDSFYDVENNRFLSECYSDLELLDLNLTILPMKTKDEYTKKLEKEAKDKLLRELEYKYIDLDETIISSQGCIIDLDRHLATLKVYAEVIEFLGGDVNKNYDNMINNYTKVIEKGEIIK